MRVVVSVETSRSVEALWAWWTDFGQAGDEFDVTHGVGVGRRRILLADPDHVCFEERLPFPGGGGPRLFLEDVRILRDARRLEVTGKGRPHWEDTWTFEATLAGGARVTRTMRIHSAALDRMGKAAEWVVRRFVQADVEHHVRQFEREVAPRAPAA